MIDKWRRGDQSLLTTKRIIFATVGLVSISRQAIIHDSTCSLGEYLRDGKFCTTCSPGYYCTGGTSSIMQMCSPGFYTSFGQSSCTQCPQGFSCADPTQPPTACPDFTYSIAGQSQCTQCPVGSVCSQGQIVATCAAGELCLSSSSTVKLSCPAGYKCTSQGQQIECPTGFYSGINSSTCTQCPVGYYCPQPATQPIQCPIGFYQDQTQQTSCKGCLAGYFCDPTKSILPIRCDLGQFSPANSAQCIDCPTGYYCPDQNIDAPLLCPKGTYSSSKSSYCMKCPEGYSCLDRKTLTSCASGYYSLTGMDSCLQCPAGYECSQFSAPMPCGPGMYSLPGAMSCTVCPTGSYCPSKDNSPIPCPLDQYQDEVGKSLCKPCPDGYTCLVKASSPVYCGDGYFTDRFHQTCYICPAGYDCSSKRYEDLKTCPPGTYSLVGESFCKKCPAGQYCIKPDEVPVDCPVNTYSQEGQTSCKMCPLGYRCLDKKGKYFIKCKLGQYVNSLTSQCQDCPAGFACPNPESGVDNMIPCDPGTYAIAGQASCTICPPGKFCPSTILATETPCAAGQISYGGATSCIPCPKNHECSGNTTVAPCPIYHYSLAGEGICKPCPNGKDCSNVLNVNPSNCPSGYYIQTLDWKCQPCPYGTYCPANAIDPIKCSKHQYQNIMASTLCYNCSAGYFSDVGSEFCQPIPAGYQRDINPASLKTLERCPESYYSDWGYPECVICPRGFLCPSGGELGVHYGCPKGSYCDLGIQHKCLPGTFGIIDRARSQDEGCADCPAGYYCLGGTENFKLFPCPRGSYCPIKTGIPPECPQGTYNDELFGKSKADCKLCPMGRECAQATKDQGNTCQKGYFCPLGSYPKQWPCPPGTFSGYRSGLKDQSECVVCPAGSYCPKATITPIQVGAGFYQPHQAIGDEAAKVICPPGYHCPNSGMVTYKGYHCSPGHYCPAGSTSPTQQKCPEGTYSDSYEIFDASQCLICPAGLKCALASTSLNGMMIDCPKNQYCPPGTQVSKINYCPPGSYAPYTNSKSLDDCIPCPYGYYCLQGSDPADCPKGYYCPKGTKASNQNPCPVGFYIDTLNAKVKGECKPCMVGNYCPEGTPAPIPCLAGTFNDLDNTAKECQTCPAGKYCPTGTSVPLKCLPGTYSASGAQACTYCEVGTYCPNEATTQIEKDANLCPAGVYCMRRVVEALATRTVGLNVYPNLRDHYCLEGYYCTEGASSMSECPIGTYNRLRGRKSLLDCQKVDAGYYTSISASSSPNGACDSGYYCPEGSTSSMQVPCPAGTFRSIKNGSKPEDCTICTSGGYCPTQGLSLPLPCPAGYYCPLGTRYPEPCPEGTYSNTLGLTDSQSCTLCDAGQYCGKRNLTAPQGNCDAGYLCIQGSKRPEPTDKVTGSICPKGGFCPSGATSPSWCDDGNFNLFEGGQSTSDCEQCWGGYYCKGQQILVPCPGGMYCTPGTIDPSLYADQGFYAPIGSDQQYQCPRGTYNDQTGQSNCKSCEAGYYCNTQQLITKLPCPQGHYCQSFDYLKSQSIYYEKSRCPAGTYNSGTGKKTSTECTPCDSGKYCATEGLSTPTGFCSAGFFCSRNAIESGPQITGPNNYYGPCPPGSYCPSGAAGSQQIPCDLGTFSSETKAIDSTVCQKCTDGFYCSSTGLTTPTGRCEVGYYCPEGSSTSRGASPTSTQQQYCKATQYCPLGTGFPLVCPPGFYQDLEYKGRCTICPKGNYCLYGVAKQCVEGYYCP